MKFNVALIGGVVGGVAGVLILIVIILVVVIVCLTLQLRTKHQGELDVLGIAYNTISLMDCAQVMKSLPLACTGSNAGNVNESSGVDSPTQQTPDNIELKQNIVYGVNHPAQTGNVDTEMNQAYGVTSGERVQVKRGPDSTQDNPVEYDYIQL